MIKSSYQEGLYYRSEFQGTAKETEKYIRILLKENHGVGILGGYYTSGYPFCMVSELALDLLKYASVEEFENATGNNMTGLVAGGEYSEEDFAQPSAAFELYLKGKGGNLRVRMVKCDFTLSSGEKIWLASICDMDALYRQGLLVSRMITEKRQKEVEQKAELERANAELGRQKVELENALARAEQNNEVISAIGKIYWQIYCLDLASGTYEEITVSDGKKLPTGVCGITAERFPAACKETVQPEYREQMLAFLDSATLADRLKEREEISQEYQTISGNWHRGRFIVQKRDASGNAVKVLYTIQIVNEQKKQELEYELRLARIAEEAQRASLSKTDFLRRMSHDIRTPINGIRGMIEIANHFNDNLKKQQEYRDKVWEASGYLLSLVNSVLDMNKLESGAVVLASDPFDLVHLLDEVNTVAEMQAVEHGLHFKVDREKRKVEHRYLIGSPSHLKQVLMNIANNAVKYNKENGSVIVWCEELQSGDDCVTFRFNCADTGIGMSKEFQAHVFEPFSQEGKNNARTRYDGSGLGLSIVKGLVEQMGGAIDFVSEEGVGTVFHVTLTFRIDPAPKTEPEEKIETQIDLSGMRILIAEDNDLNMEIAKFFVEQSGGIAITARNGQEAVDKFFASDPFAFDLVLMDIMMPIKGGYEATTEIRNSGREDAKIVPIIAMSANAFQDDVKKSLAVGMNAHLAKPLATEKLLSTVYRYAIAARKKREAMAIGREKNECRFNGNAD